MSKARTLKGFTSWMLALLGLGMAVCGQLVPSEVHAATPRMQTFRAKTLLPYFSGQRFRVLHSALRFKRCAQAQRLVHSFQLQKRTVARVMIGRCYMLRRQYKKARTWLLPVRLKLPLIRDYIQFWIAETYRKEKMKEEAVRFYKRVPRHSLLYYSARLHAGKLLFKKRDFSGTVRVLRPRSWRYAVPAIWWLSLRAATRSKKHVDKKLTTWLARRIWSRAPASQEAKNVVRWRRARKVFFRISVADRVRRARRLNRMYDYRKALKALRRVRIARSAPQKMRCQFYYARGYAWFRRRSYSPAIRDLRQARKACRGQGRLDVRSLYRLGQAYRRRGRDEDAARILRELAKRFPGSFLADDALFMIADRADRRGKKELAKRVYSEMMRRFPSGDMVSVARWRLSYQSYRKGMWKKAIRRFKTLIRYNARSKYAPRAHYYLARAYEKQAFSRARTFRKKRLKRAVKVYKQLIERHPMHYYSFLALMRMQRRTRKRWKIWRVPLRSFLKKEVSRTVWKRPLSKSRRWQYLPWGPLPHRPPNNRELTQMFDGAKAPFLHRARYRKGRMLYRMGFRKAAGLEWVRLRKCHVFFPKQKKRKRRWGCGRRGDPGALVLALHFHIAEQYYHANWTFRARGIPAGRMRMSKAFIRNWYLAYPQPFRKIVDPAVAVDGVDRGMVYGIMREESAFRTETRSWANAHGLMQFILPTARSTARTLWPRRRITAADLYKPKIGIRLGVRHLLQLYRMLRKQYPLMAGAYNAGPGWVRRWLRRYKTLQFDEWNDAVSIKETRRYIQRVMQSFSIYRLLYHPRRKRWVPAPFSPYARPSRIMATSPLLRKRRRR